VPEPRAVSGIGFGLSPSFHISNQVHWNKSMRIVIIVGLLLLCSLKYPSYADDLSTNWNDADLQVQRLQPSAFSELPQNIKAELESRGCTIPQVKEYGTIRPPHNVIQGEFSKKGQLDWAVLCSKNRSSSILIFWNGLSKTYSEMAKGQDKDSLQIINGDQIGFSRLIGVAGKDFIKTQLPIPIDHDGINDEFVNKGSVVYYYSDGRWLSVIGED